MSVRYYAGVGSRETPADVLLTMEEIARDLEVRGYTLRSGGALGADTAFLRGVQDFRKAEIFDANDCTDEAMELSGKLHPAWDRCSEYAKKLHGRNAMILLGEDLQTPVDFVLLWTPGGKGIGGTGQAIRIAKEYDIPVYNMFNSGWVFDWHMDFRELVESLVKGDGLLK